MTTKCFNDDQGYEEATARVHKSLGGWSSTTSTST